MQQRAASIVTLLAFCLATKDAAFAEELASLREKITNNLSTIGSIEVRYQVVIPPLKNPPKLKALPPGIERPTVHVWAKQGSREFHEIEARPIPGDNRFSRTKWSFDGRQYVGFKYSEMDPEVVNMVDVRNNPPRDARGDIMLLYLTGLSVFQTQLSLPELLKRASARYVGTEEVEGHLCHKIELGEYEGFTDYIRRFTIWLDPQG